MLPPVVVPWQMHYDRRVSPGFLDNFLPDGAAALLAEYAKHAPYPVDLQLRHDAKTGSEHASLYVGLTAVINVAQAAGGQLRADAHPHWANLVYGFENSWRDELRAADWLAVEAYLEAVIPRATASHASQEGAVQAAVSVFTSGERIMLDREAVIHFRDKIERNFVMSEIVTPITDALTGLTGIPGQVKSKFGGKCDFLAIDGQGRLMTVEVKPRGVSSIMWAAAQATVYARLFEKWLGATDLPVDGKPLEVLQGMAGQRAALGLAAPAGDRLRLKPAVVPVVAVQRGAAATHLDALRRVQAHLIEKGVGHPGLELHEVNMAGRLRRLPL